ncbi:DUF6944 family repetitive protein [Ornithinibacillus salinisoli]|uniref:DUF6944 family repetitive protein n=1 Tax=Ornithinibacillus salinisoli TaxID=1848459 RepID=A0ABW4W2G7_9BACI
MTKELIGSWLQAVGTVLAAVAASPTGIFDENYQHDLNLIGNTLQATGSALQATDQTSLSSIGNEVQAIGNSTIVYGLIIPTSEKTKTELNIKGNLLQALGGGIAFADETVESTINRIGNLLQAIGNSMQAIGNKMEWDQMNHPSNDEDSVGASLNTIGNWIQAIGAVIIAIDQTNTNW